MIRFVDIRAQGTGYRFAFWDTTRDGFCEFSGDQAWESATDFAESFNLAAGQFADAVRVSGIERFTDLMPDWTATPMGAVGSQLERGVSRPYPARKDRVEMHTKERPADVLLAVHHELSKALAKFPTWPTDPLHALAVLGEEFGELTKDILQMTYEPGKTNAENVRKEAIQTAAMALRFVASLDAYIYKAGEQHRQEQWKAQQQAYAESGGLHPCYD